MSEVLGYLTLAFVAACFVCNVAAEIHACQRGQMFVVGRIPDRAPIDVAGIVKRALRRMRQQLRHRTCSLVHGGHELYRARSDTKLFQQCLLCGYATPGWTIDRRDRRLHLVASNSRRDVA